MSARVLKTGHLEFLYVVLPIPRLHNLELLGIDYSQWRLAYEGTGVNAIVPDFKT